MLSYAWGVLCALGTLLVNSRHMVTGFVILPIAWVIMPVAAVFSLSLAVEGW